jgi:peptidoglycan/LPS O-acetylase OafA/YrhL
MAAVVLLHCIEVSCSQAGMSSGSLLERCFLQPFKFATIGFFLISGFLMGESLTKRPPLDYLKRRLRRILVPWLFWVSLYAAVVLGDLFFEHHLLHSGSLSADILRTLELLYGYIFVSAYWFVPNLLFALCVLLYCRRFLMDLRLGCILMACSMFYGLNMYAHWVSGMDHSRAIFGFIFYLWLGMWAERHFAALQATMARIPAPFMFSLAAVTGLVALCESSGLSAAGDPFAMSSLRVSNQVYSIVMALALFKLHKPISPRIVNVRTTTFGIYLTHSVVLVLLLNLFVRPVLRGSVGPIAGSQALTAIVLSLCFFSATYGASLALTEWILRYPQLHWMVGVAIPDKTMHLR